MKTNIEAAQLERLSSDSAKLIQSSLELARNIRDNNKANIDTCRENLKVDYKKVLTQAKSLGIEEHIEVEEPPVPYNLNELFSPESDGEYSDLTCPFNETLIGNDNFNELICK